MAEPSILSDSLVVYRPQFSTDQPEKLKHTSTRGTAAEIDYAMERAGRPVFVVHDPEVDGSLRREVFDPALPAAAFYILDEIGNLSDPDRQRRVLEELTERLKEHGDRFVKRRLRR